MAAGEARCKGCWFREGIVVRSLRLAQGMGEIGRGEIAVEPVCLSERAVWPGASRCYLSMAGLDGMRLVRMLLLRLLMRWYDFASNRRALVETRGAE